MSKKPEYVQLDAEDDVGTVRDRLSFIRGKRVLLIWPEEGTALPRKLDLVLVLRHAGAVCVSTQAAEWDIAES